MIVIYVRDRLRILNFIVSNGQMVCYLSSELVSLGSKSSSLYYAPVEWSVYLHVISFMLVFSSSSYFQGHSFPVPVGAWSFTSECLVLRGDMADSTLPRVLEPLRGWRAETRGPSRFSFLIFVVCNLWCQSASMAHSWFNNGYPIGDLLWEFSTRSLILNPRNK